MINANRFFMAINVRNKQRIYRHTHISTTMKKQILILLLYSLCGNALAQPKIPITHITLDSLNMLIDRNWMFHAGDSAAYALPLYNDSTWEITRSELYFADKPQKDIDSFNGICWLRFHFTTDTGIARHPLALKIVHSGASEIYLDGQKIVSFGLIGTNKNCKYYDPHSLPFIINAPEVGAHVLAIRYANYNAAKNKRMYHQYLAGIQLQVEMANSSVRFHFFQAKVITFTLVLLFGIFFALSVLHLCLYIYYRPGRSNLYFSIFCASASCMLILLFFYRFSSNPYRLFYGYYISPFIIAAGCISLSGFMNQLFSGNKTRVVIIAVLFLATSFLWILYPIYGLYAFGVLISVVALESVILTLSAVFKKVKGARIITFGICMFSVYTLIFICVLAVNRDFSDASIWGLLMEIFGVVAILSVPGSMSVYLAWSFAYVNKNLTYQLQQVQLLSRKTLEQEQEKKQLLENRKEELEKEVAQRTEEIMAQKAYIEVQNDKLRVEKKKSDDLLLNILPGEIAEELKNKGTSAARLYDNVTVLLTDFVDFTQASERLTAQQVVDELDACFKVFDSIMSKYGIEKIKTIGDAYLAVCGLPTLNEHHAINMANAAIEIREFMGTRREQMGDSTFEVRIGMHSGSAVAGIVGLKKFAYDIWGDTVNTAARMEQHSEAGKINISQTTFELIKNAFECIYRGEIYAKNKGVLKMYFLERLAKH